MLGCNVTMNHYMNESVDRPDFSLTDYSANDMIDYEIRSVKFTIDGKKYEIEVKNDVEALVFDAPVKISNPEIITELKITNIEKLKQKLWLSYFKKEEVYLNTLKELYQSTKSEIEEIEKKAQEQFTKWEQVVDEFKKRFSLPFEILITNSTFAHSKS